MRYFTSDWHLNETRICNLMDSVNKCYCVDNACGWEDDEDEE